MIVTRLRLANLRAIEAAEFRFQPGFNLIVGVNGVGKTSVLDALGVCLAAVTRAVNQLRFRAESFSVEDIRIGAEALTAECEVRLDGGDYAYLLHKPRYRSSPQAKGAGMPRAQVHATPEKAEFLGPAPAAVSGREAGGRPLAVLFSTNRSVPSDRAPGRNVAAGGIAAAFGDAFANRELRLGEFAAWLRVQDALRKERPASARALRVMQDTIAEFLPGYRNLRPSKDKVTSLWIDRGPVSIPVRQLSDGERGTLAVVLDLTRRLTQANPGLANPVTDAAAVVLIDEIDLHLHPKWQRQVVHNLTAAFPQCQFIATTHSPQVIGEVEHDHIQIMSNGRVYSPTHSYGVDSSRVLEEVMDSAPRAKEVSAVLTNISRAIGRQKFEDARELLARLVAVLGESDPEVTRTRTLLDFVEGKE